VRALRHRNFAIFWTGALASNTGTWLQNLVIPYVLYEQTHSALLLGLATFGQFVPTMVFGPLGGTIADRFDRRRVLLVTQSLLALAAAALWLAWIIGFRASGAILGLVALCGVFTGLSMPSWQAFVNDLVPPEDLLSAVTLNSLQFNAARAVGPAMAGVLLATIGPGWAFFLNAVSFGCVLLGLWLVRLEPVARHPLASGGFIRQFRRALTYAASQPGIILSILVVMLVGALGNPVFQFTVIYARDVFSTGPLGLGLMNLALGVGAVAAAPVASGWDSLSRSGLVRWSLLIYGAAIIAFASSRSYAMALVALVVVGGSFLVVVSVTNTATQVMVADHMRGRVIALRIMAFTGAYPLGALAQAAIADVIGPRWTVRGAGGLLFLVALALGFRRRWLVRLDDPHDDGNPPPARTPAF
jgi:MFS family permease